MQKTGTGLNPNADTFFYTKALTPSSVDKGWEPGEGELVLEDFCWGLHRVFDIGRAFFRSGKRNENGVSVCRI